MPRDGINWYTDPGVIGQKFSAFSKHITADLGRATSESIDEAVQTMRARVIGLPRIRFGYMFNSIDGHMEFAKSGLVRGNFGFIDNAPFYTLFQEYGTRGRHGGMDKKATAAGFTPKATAGNGGIAPMHAFVDASMVLQTRLHDRISRIDFWKDFR